MSSILLVDSWPVVTTGLSGLLHDAGIENNITQAHGLQEAVKAMNGQLALLILDPGVLDTTPDVLVSLARRRQPNLPILFFSTQSHGLNLSLAYMLSVNGYLEKTSDAATIIAAIRTVLAGMQCFPHQQSCTVSGDAAMQKLSSKELVILQLLRQGLRNKDIAQRLFLSPKTVSAHKNNLLRKLGLTDIVPARLERRSAYKRQAVNHSEQLLLSINDSAC